MGTLYGRAVLNDPQVTLRFSDPLVGLVEPGDVDLHLSNHDHYFDTRDLRGGTVDYWRWDKLSNEQWYELSGRVVSQTLKADRIILKCKTYDLDAFQTKLPKNLVTAATFPLADPQQGLGRPIPIPWGICPATNEVNDAWELPWVGDTSGAYDYLVGPGTYTNISVFRDTVGDKLFLVPGSEYSVNTSAYSGYTVIRFSLRQRNFSGGFHRIFAVADVAGADRNFANFIKYLINDSTHGLGLAVNAASFSTAAAALPSGLYCDGVISEQVATVDVIRQLLMAWGMVLKLNSSGEYTLTVDTMQTTIKGQFGHGVGQSYGGVTDFEGISTTPVSEAVKSLIVDYRRDRWSDRYILNTTARSVLAVGSERRIELDFVRVPETADRIACRIAKALYYGDARLPLPAGQMARKLLPGDLIRYHSIAPAFDRYFVMREISRGLTESQDEAIGWSSDTYAYSPTTLPAEPASVTETDWSRSTPTVASSLSVTSSGVETNDQGVKSAYMVLQYTIPNEPWAQTVVKYTKDGETLWTSLPGENGSGVKTTKIPGLVGSQVYDLRIVRENILNPTLTATADLANQTAPGDTTAPSDPTAIAVRQAGGKSVEIDVTFTAPSDWGTTVLYRNTTNNSGTATEIERGKKKRFHDQNVTYGSTYYYWVKVADQSGNLSGFSPSSSHSLTIVQIVTGDVTDGHITTPKVADSNITTPKVNNNAITVSGLYSNDSNISVDVTEIEVGTITVSTDGGPGDIEGSVNVNMTDQAMALRIRKDSTSGSTLGFAEVDKYGSIHKGVVTIIGYDASPASSQTYKLTAQRTNGAGTFNASYRRLKAKNFKK